MQETEGSQRGHQSPRMCVSAVGHGGTTVESIKLRQTTPTHLQFTRNPGTQGAIGWGQAAEAKRSGCRQHREKTRSSQVGKGWWSPFLDGAVSSRMEKRQRTELWLSRMLQVCSTTRESSCFHSGPHELSTDLSLAHGRPKAKDLSVSSELSGQHSMNAIEMKGPMACRLLSLKL